MNKQKILFSGLYIVGLLFSGCATQQVNTPQHYQREVIDEKSRLAIAALIQSLEELEATQNRQAEQIRFMQIERNSNETQSVAKVKVEDTEPAKSKQSIAKKAHGNKYMVTQNVHVRACGVQTCEILGVFSKGHIFFGDEPMENGWIETKEHTFVYSKYVKKIKQ